MHIAPLHYRTALTPPECIAAITAQPWEYGDALMPLWYDCIPVEQQVLDVTFRGGKFRKAMRSRYRMTFTEDADGTAVVLEFISELLGAPPMTPPADIDRFMEQKLLAIRVTR
ncbi:MAG: hypothetical protein IJA49_03835 [Oscillospiraceae bacterium]|nr:hypothetical protein [Oscillospiraceae bacterium]